MAVSLLSRFLRSLSFLGVVLGLLFCAASLTPSLLPRPFPVQGVLSGVVFSVGYSVGWLSRWTWGYLGLPGLPDGLRLWLGAPMIALSFGTLAYTLGHVTEWQNTLRSLMEMEPVSSAHPFRIFWVAVLTSLVLLLLARSLILLGRVISSVSNRLLPPRISALLAVTLVVFLTVTLVNRVVLANALQAMDEAFANLNELIEPDRPQPVGNWQTGSPASLFDWQDVGRRGRDFVATGPTAAEISDLTGRPAKEPIRVYAGYTGDDRLAAQAELALKELVRAGGFERKVLIVATPTGTGWLDPAGVDTVETLHDGDTAIVALQYSYLPSWTTLLIDPDRSRIAAHLLFQTVYRHWLTLPEATRPELYLFGLSLGALGSEHSASIVQLLNDPFHGALWSGPPFPSTIWQQLMNSGDSTGPAWLPKPKDDRLFRFAGPEGVGTPSREGWGRMRILYIQHASDPMSFFSTNLAFSRPRWLQDRGPDVSPHMRWNPLVLFFQVGFDIFLATSVPIGYGHNFAPGAYIDGWLAVTAPKGWSPDDVARLKAHFEAALENQ